MTAPSHRPLWGVYDVQLQVLTMRCAFCSRSAVLIWAAIVACSRGKATTKNCTGLAAKAVAEERGQKHTAATTTSTKTLRVVTAKENGE